ncbi:TaqI family restriction endonuclease [Candidatus Woesearchaeota archaeon]|nr:TaqI family restriction endonuclease [Candidatus Woesearchaeota archaeon]
MGKEVNYRRKFEQFLESVDLGRYREKYRPIKLVEMDLPKNIHALATIYRTYWEEKRFIDFDEFYSEYLKEKESNLEDFRIKIGMCDKCFYKGLPARIYRTWASLITQI